MGIATKFNPGAIIKAYSLTMEHIAKVADMSQRTGHSQGQTVRKGIDIRWEIVGAAEQLEMDPDELQNATVDWLRWKIENDGRELH